MSSGDTITRTIGPAAANAAPPPMATGDTPSLRRLRRIIAFALVTLLFLAGVRLWFVHGLLRQITIAGPSMAPSLCGQHYAVICADCGFEFRCDAEHVPTDEQIACPNCGFTRNSLNEARQRPPDRVLVDAWQPYFFRLRRGIVVALEVPGNTGDLAVKRIAALPGQRLIIRDGDLYHVDQNAGEQLIRKSRGELHALRLLVHENDHQPHITTSLPLRWKPRNENSRWQSAGPGLQIEPTTMSPSEFDWLEYEHWPCTAEIRTRGVVSPITDNDSYNQAETRRSLNAVHDVLFTCQLSAAGTGNVIFAALDGDQRFEVEIEPQARVVLRINGRTVTDQPLKVKLSRQPIDLEFGLFDQQVLLAAQGKTILLHPYERPGVDSTAAIHPLAIGTRGLGLHIEQLRIWRDIYYLDSHGLPRQWDALSPLASDQFALLGDNQPVSIDSRHWNTVGISRSAILGRVYKPFWSRQQP